MKTYLKKQIKGMIISCVLIATLLFPQAVFAGASGPIPPTPPAVDSVVFLSGRQVQFNWTAITGAHGFKLYRSETIKGAYKIVATIEDANATSLTDTTLDPEVDTYYYKLATYTKWYGPSGYVGDARALGDPIEVNYVEPSN